MKYSVKIDDWGDINYREFNNKNDLLNWLYGLSGGAILTINNKIFDLVDSPIDWGKEIKDILKKL